MLPEELLVKPLFAVKLRSPLSTNGVFMIIVPLEVKLPQPNVAPPPNVKPKLPTLTAPETVSAVVKVSVPVELAPQFKEVTVIVAGKPAITLLSVG